MVNAKQGIYFLSGSAYAGSVVPMQIIMPTLLLIGITNILGIQILVPLGREKTVLYSEVAGAVVDLILNALLIPQLASSGAAIGTLAAEFTVLIVQFAALHKEVSEAFHRIAYWKILLGLVAGAACSYWFVRFGFGNFLTLLVTACLFFGAYGLVLFITREKLTREILRQVAEKVLGRVRR